MFDEGDLASFYQLGAGGIGAKLADYRTKAGAVRQVVVVLQDMPDAVGAEGVDVRTRRRVGRVRRSELADPFARGDSLAVYPGDRAAGGAVVYPVNGRSLSEDDLEHVLTLGAPAS